MEFHAIILCGKGKALSPLSQVRSSGIPKALLPIANTPMIEYVLEWCEKAFFPRVTVVASSSAKVEIEAAVTAYKQRRAITIAAQQEEAETNPAAPVVEDTYTTAISVIEYDADYSGEILYHFYKTNQLKTQSSFVLLPCDFITNLPPQVLIEAYRYKEDSELGLFIHYRNQLDIEDKKSQIFPKNYTIYTELPDGRTQLLDVFSNEDIEPHKSLQVRTQLCWRYPNSTVSTKMLNGSIFFGSTEAIFKVFEASPNKYNEAYFKFRPITKVIRDLARRSWKHTVRKDSVGFLVIPEQATFFRCNNLPVLMEANRYYMKLQASKGQQPQLQQQPKEKGSANIGLDSLIGEGTTLGERTNVKRTVVSTNCVIGKRVKLTGCIILANCVIEDEVQLENCIVGQGVTIRSKSKLTNCNVESTFEVVKGTQSKGDNLLCLTLEGLVDDESAFPSESESESESSSGEEGSSDEGEFSDEFANNDDGLFDY